VRRTARVLVCAGLVALAVAAGGHVLSVVVPDACRSITPDDVFWWWWYGCEKDAAGGGAGGAG
jgi:hypothetical protein